MGLIYKKDVKMETLYSSYGYTVSGKIMQYEWTIFDKEEEDCITELSITDAENEEVFKIVFGNDPVLKNTFDKYVDSLLWWIAHDKPDTYNIENIFQKNFISNSPMFDYKIRNRKMKEKQEAEIRAAQLEREKKEAEAVKNIQAYCKRKKLHMVRLYEKIYLLKINDERAIAVIDSMSGDSLENSLNGDFKEFNIIKVGTLEELEDYVK